jgi:phosphoribosylglycinamide formyltransferase-1
MQKKVVSFLASGRGSNFQAVAKKIKSGEIANATLGILISDVESAKALEIARSFGMKAFFVDPKTYPDRVAHEKAIVRHLIDAKTDLIVAAGYMRILTPYFVQEYRHRIINIHPALLPSFPGVHAQKQAFDYGVKITGCTTHFIDEGTDSGPIIMQKAVSVLPNDTAESLAERILKNEHEILPQSVDLFCRGKLEVVGRKVFIK